MKIGAVGDLHGEEPDIDREEMEKADFILATGDFCAGRDEVRSLMFESIGEDWNWYEKMGEEQAKKEVKASLDAGREVLEYLNSFGKPVYVVPGNWDWSGEIYSDWSYLNKDRFQELVDEFDNIHNINYTCSEDHRYSIIGYGPCSGPELPQYEEDMPKSQEELEDLKQEFRETKKQLSKLYEQAENPVIFLSHNVPHDTSLDMIDNEESPKNGRHYGSVIVKELIEEKQPLLSVAGHMHEGYGIENIKNTSCLNAGLNAYGFINLNGENVEFTNFHPEIN